MRDCLHPRDLVPLLRKQMETRAAAERVVNVSGGTENSMSLAQLSAWCAERFGLREVEADAQPRPFDLPWMVLDARLAQEQWGWKVETPLPDILEEIAVHAENNPDWLELSNP